MSRQRCYSNDNENLSPVLEDYLVTILRLESIYGIAKTCKIAEELNVAPATVSKILEKLRIRGFITWNKYQGVKLSDKGRCRALKILRKHRIMERFLVEFLGFNKYEAHVYAHNMEHIPDEVVEKIYDLLGKPSTCPHGNPISITDNNQDQGHNTLDKVDIGQYYRVLRITSELNNPLKIIMSTGINVGIVLKIKDKNSSKIRIEIPSQKRECDIDIEYARLIHVIPCNDKDNE